MLQLTAICVYCGSSPGKNAAFVDAAQVIGKAIADNGLRLVYGGGGKGIMGAVSSACIEAGGKVTAIIPEFLIDEETKRAGLEQMDGVHVTPDMHTRKRLMFDNCDAFIALPGGIGTLEELFEILTWAQLGRHHKPVVIANINGYWNPLAVLLQRMDEAGFIHNHEQVRPQFINEAEAIIPWLLAHGRVCSAAQ